MRLLLLFLFALGPLWGACQNRIGSSITRIWESDDQAIPTSATDLIDKTVIVDVLSLTNTTAGDLTVTILNKAGSPLAFFNAVTIKANTTYVIPFGEAGKRFTGGIRWSASGAGVVGYAYGCRAP